MTWYYALNRVRAAETRGVGNHQADLTDYHRVFEEYRYDALGRRVWVRARKDCRLMNHGMVEDLCKLSTIRRTVWDGNQELWEIQMPGADGSPHLENDVTTLQLPRTNILDPNPSFGRVVYTHGTGIDQPLGITRLGYGDVTDSLGVVTFPFRSVDPFTISPLWDARPGGHGHVR